MRHVGSFLLCHVGYQGKYIFKILIYYCIKKIIFFLLVFFVVLNFCFNLFLFSLFFFYGHFTMIYIV